MALEREFQRGRDSAGHNGGEVEYSPGQRVNSDGAASVGVGGGYRGGSLFAGEGRGAMYDAPASGTDNLGGALGASVASGPAPTGPVEGAEAPAAVAEQGFAGAGQELPHKAMLERTMGVSLDGIRAHTHGAAQTASNKLGAAAYAAGSDIAFANSNPDASLVAHEATHVLQQRAGKLGTGGGSGVETAGEGEAERVEAAVASGRSAKGALDIDPRSVAGKGDVGGGKRPSLSSPFSSGMTFSPNGLEQRYAYKLWESEGIRAPVAAVPGLFITVSPEVSVGVNGGVDWTKGSVGASLTVDGLVGVGLAYGDPHLAEIYANMEAMASGGFRYERERAEGHAAGNHAATGHAAARPAFSWTLDGGIILTTTFNVGVRLGGGIIDKRFELGRVEIGRLTGLSWKNGTFEREKVGWQWGPVPQGFFREVNAQIQRARQIMRMGAQAAEQAWHSMSSSAGWAYNGARRALSAINPFD